MLLLVFGSTGPRVIFAFKKVLVEDPSSSAAAIAFLQEILAPIKDSKSLVFNIIDLKVYLLTLLFLLFTVVICLRHPTSPICDDEDDKQVVEKEVRKEVEKDVTELVEKEASQEVDKEVTELEHIKRTILLCSSGLDDNGDSPPDVERDDDSDDDSDRSREESCDGFLIEMNESEDSLVTIEEDDITAASTEAPASPRAAPEEEVPIGTWKSPTLGKRLSRRIKCSKTSNSLGKIRRKLSSKKISSVKKLFK